MSRQPKFARFLLCVLCAGAAAPARADDVLDNVPSDALAVVVVRNLATVDAKFRALKLLDDTRSPLPTAVLQAVTGPDTGLDAHGDFLLVARASDGPLDSSPLGVWLPVTDYDRFARSLGGDPAQRVTVITVLGEDVLCAHQGKWAVVMDAEQRRQLDDLLAGPSSPPVQLAAWRDWIRGNDVAAIVLPTAASRKALRTWAGDAVKVNEREADPFGATPTIAARQRTFDDLFSPAGASESGDDGFLSTLRREVQRFLAAAPKLASLALDTDAAALGVRIDEVGGVVAGIRMASKEPSWAQGGEAAPGNKIGEVTNNASTPQLHRDGEFSISGGGFWPKPLATAAIDAAVRKTIADARSEPKHPRLDPPTVERFTQASEQAMQDVLAASIFHAPGGPQMGVYTNDFLAVRVSSADAFAAHCAEVLQAWNEMSKKASPGLEMAFESQAATIGGRKGTQYTLDVAASVGAADTSELRLTMERLFGPDRKLHLFVVPIDKQTVLLAEATSEQTLAAVKYLSGAPAATWETANVAASNRLLPPQADWRLFVSLAGYTKWLKQETDAVLGDAIGIQPTRQFPAAPPLGLAGGFRDGQLWVDAVVPANTMRAAAAYINKEQ